MPAADVGFSIAYDARPCSARDTGRSFAITFGPPASIAPVATIVSPTPGVPAGAAGGFSADWSVARVTPLVIDIDGSNLTIATVVARYPLDEDDTIERVIYRRGEFRAGFAASSYQQQISATKLRLFVLPNLGWPSVEALHGIEVDVDAVAGGALSDGAASS